MSILCTKSGQSEICLIDTLLINGYSTPTYGKQAAQRVESSKTRGDLCLKVR